MHSPWHWVGLGLTIAGFLSILATGTASYRSLVGPISSLLGFITSRCRKSHVEVFPGTAALSAEAALAGVGTVTAGPFPEEGSVEDQAKWLRLQCQIFEDKIANLKNDVSDLSAWAGTEAANTSQAIQEIDNRIAKTAQGFNGALNRSGAVNVISASLLLPGAILLALFP